MSGSLYLQTSPAATLIEVLQRRAAETPDRPAYLFLADGEAEAESLTWTELDARVRTVAAALTAKVPRGERALLLYPPGLEFVAAFLGCLAAGIIAVPAYPPRPRRDQPRLRAILGDATPQVALTTTELAGGIEMAVPLLATDTLPAAPEWDGPLPEAESIAFLQYTSGSTSLPKGVTVTHANLVHNSGMIQRAFRQDEESVVVGWLPLYHDMGLIGNVLQPLWCGGRCVLMAPVAFLQRPRRWLEAIHCYRATTSGGPNFAYELCAHKIGPAEREGLDLSSWRVAFNGAEPVRAEALERFAAAFGPQGFRREAFYPCYGLAEATLFVSGATLGEPVRVEAVDAAALERHETRPAGDGPARRLVSCGRAWEGQRIVVADPESAPETGVELPPGRVGEVWVAGPSVAAGYWGRPEVTERDFQARLDSGDPGDGPFLRTGDLGFMADGELFVTGRLKDLIILRGRNHYPQDLERTAEASHPELRRGGAAAFAVEVDGEERLVVALEVERRRRADLTEIAGAVRRAVAEEHEVQVHEVVLLKPGGLPKTSSGKVQRHACRAGYLDGSLEALGTSTVGKRDEVPPKRPAPSREELAALSGEERREAVLAWLGDRVAALAGLGARPAPEQPLTELGLDSLSAVELKGEVEAAFGATVPLIELLGGWGIGEVAEWVLTPGGEGVAMGRIGRIGPIGPMIRTGVRGLSTGQEALWFLERLAPTGGAYNIAVAARVVGPALDSQALRRALVRLAERHPALRTTFHAQDDGAPVQRVGAPAVDFAVAESQDELMAEAWRPFDLENGPLLRVRLLPDGSVVLLAVHHLIADFWSLAVASRELGALYREETGGAVAELPSLQEDYAGFVERQREMLAGPRGEVLWSFWRQALAGPPPDLDLPTDLPRPPLPSFRGGARAARLAPELADGARALARQSGATLFTTLLAVWETLLGRWTGQEDFAVGSPTTGRTEADLAGVVGYFVNPVPLRADLTGDPPFAAHLERTRSAALAALEHADFPLPLLVERLQPSRDPSRSPLFQTMFILQAVRPGEDPGLAAFSLGEAGARVDLGGLVLESMALRERRSQFDLTLRLAPVADGGLGAVLEYAADLFVDDTAGRLLGHFQNLLSGAVADPARRLWDLPLLSADERRQLLADWNAAGRETPRRDVCLHELFAEQVDRTPEAEALVDGTRRLTYGELAARSHRLAGELRRLGVGPEVRVGVCLPRSADLVAALLGVLEAGGAYVPLDPAYPKERVAFMLEDSGAQVLVTCREAAMDVPGFGGRWVELTPHPLTPSPTPSLPPGEGEEEDCGEGRGRPSPGRGEGVGEGTGVRGDNLAYLIYTSGSTGRPKGVAIEHRSAAALVDWSRGVFSPEDLTGVLAATSVCFDLSIFEIFVPLSRGGRVILAENALALPTLPAAEEVTLVNTVPSAMAELVRSGGVPRSVRVINLAGEPIPPALAEAIHALGGPRLYDLYGPSEDTTYSTGTLLVPGGDVTIGRPIAGTRGYLLGRRGELLPAGVPGELHLGGAGLARGYLGRPDLTAERFVPDPFSEEPGGRLYRTGDLVRLRRDGDLDFLGRLDHQVKVRGFRIELGEVEAAIARYPGVRGVAVLAPEDGGAAARGRRLVAFVETDLPDLRAVRESLRRTLPEPMIPGAWVALPALPLTPNGKVDRRALARLEVRPEPSRQEGDAPRTPTEELLAGLWCEVLGIERVGRRDNFFDLGGHSLLAMRLTGRLHAAFGVEPPLTVLFENPTVARLAAFLEHAREGTGALEPSPIRPVPRGGDLPASFAQERLWFLDRLAPGSAAYNMPAGIRLTGRLRAAALERALEEVVRRHESLRTALTESAGQPLQSIQPIVPVALPVIDLTALPATAPEAARLGRQEASRPFDLRLAPLLRASLLRLAPEEHVLVLVLHHAVADGWSTGLLLGELAALYEAFAGGRPLSPGALPPLPVQYADYAVWQREHMRGEVLASHLAFWRERLAGLPVLELPADHPRPPLPGFRGAVRRATLPAALGSGLRDLGRRQGGTPFMTLLAAFAVLLGRCARETRLAVGSPVANRRAEVEGLIGLFVNTLVLPVDLGGDPPFPGLLARVRETCLAAYAHQELPFERLVEELRPEREPGRNPLFQVLFAVEETLPSREAAGVRLAPEALENGTAKLDLTFTLTSLPGGGLAVEARYDPDLFDAATMERLVGHFHTLLEGLVAAPAARLSDLPFLDDAARHQLLREWNDTAWPGPEPPVHHAIAAQAARTPERIAVALGNRSMTYRELAERADLLARRLAAAGVGPEEVVGLCLERSPEMVAAILGVLAAGAAYLPLEPVHPPERLAWMAADAGARWIVTREPRAGLAREIVEAQGSGSARLLDLDEIPGAETGAVLQGEVTPGSLAYVLYTSGSTGTPKGVVVPHGALASYLAWAGRAYGMSDGSGAPVHSPLGFDLTVTSLFLPLLAGGTVTLLPEEQGVEALRDTLRGDVRFGLFKLTPAHLAYLGESLGGSDLAGRAGVLVVGGEALLAEAVAAWRSRETGPGPRARVINEYGPTETTVGCCVYELPPETGAGAVAIGRPIANTRIHLLGPDLRPVPLGAPGEIAIGGAGLARGYRGRPDLTAERFVPDPESDRPGERLYRSGDLARRLPGGDLVFLGRRDRQVKIRGFRIELAEVEAALALHPEVAEAVAATFPGGDGTPWLAAFVVLRAPRDGGEPPADLTGFLARRLPAHMIPTSVTALPALPLTANGKVDLEALPRPEHEPDAGFVEPRTPTEREVAAIWRDVLGIERAGLGRSFFDLGGHSLLAARALARIEEHFGVELPLRELYGSPTIESLAAKIEEALLAQAGDARLDELLDLLEGGEEDPALLAELLASEGAGTEE